MDDRLIVRAIQKIHPEWEPPKDNGRRWIKTLCPFHSESVASASISFTYNAFNCFACGAKGDWKSLLKKHGGLTRAEIDRVAEGVSPDSYGKVPEQPARKPSRRVFGDTGPGDAVSGSSGRDRQVHARVRGRSTPWT